MPSLELIPLFKATWETIYIVFASSLLSSIAGLGLGLLLFLNKPKAGTIGHPWLYRTLSFVVNITRSVPFIILMISILPLTRLLVGTTIGTNAAIVPLAIAAIPFYARICENAFSEIPVTLLETAEAFGMNTAEFIGKVLIPESLPALIRGITLTIIALVGYSAMAGVVGGGGLGELAINYGYQRFNAIVTIETVFILVVLVQLVQWGGEVLALKRQWKPMVAVVGVLGLLCIGSQLLPFLNGGSPELRVGVMAGWPEEVMKVAQDVAQKKYHLRIKVVTFNDYVLPNTALQNGYIDANIFQHVPYLNTQIHARGFAIAPIGKTFVYPMGFYAAHIHDIAALKRGAMVAIPNDPSNEARALLLLQKAGLITLRGKEGNVSVRDIVENPRHLQFKALDAAQLPRTLNDADLVALTNDYLLPAHKTIAEAVIKEGADSQYANVIVARQSDRQDPALKELVEVMHTKEVLDATQKIFPKGAAISAW